MVNAEPCISYISIDKYNIKLKEKTRLRYKNCFLADIHIPMRRRKRKLRAISTFRHLLSDDDDDDDDDEDDGRTACLSPALTSLRLIA